MDILVTYDIATISREGERRLSQVAAICERYGRRVQQSVFECHLDLASLERLKGELMDVVNPTEDVIDIYRFDRDIDDARVSLGRPHLRRGVGSWIFGRGPEPPVILDN
jgi:CRISPR-associated protein Cas2